MKKISILVITLFLMNCGSENNKSSSSPKGSYQLVPKDISTPPDQGGYGFEKIAKGMGFVTYEYSEEDYQYYGSDSAKKGGHLKFTLGRFPATFRALGQYHNYTENYYILNALCYESLLSSHPVTLERTPGLASHWKISDDKMEFWFRINPDARWSDGQEVTAEDIVASYDIRMDETILMPSTQITYGKIERPEVIKCEEQLDQKTFWAKNGIYIENYAN